MVFFSIDKYRSGLHLSWRSPWNCNSWCRSIWEQTCFRL